MGKDEYATSGGALKLKGAKNAGIDKKRRKKKEQIPTNQTENKQTNPAEEAHEDLEAIRQGQDVASVKKQEQPRDSQEVAGKTEAEKRHEEMRRKRLDERLKREGVKTHKEKVEELNSYLSRLSEHHDMPRIGPG